MKGEGKKTRPKARGSLKINLFLDEEQFAKAEIPADSGCPTHAATSSTSFYGRVGKYIHGISIKTYPQELIDDLRDMWVKYFFQQIEDRHY